MNLNQSRAFNQFFINLVIVSMLFTLSACAPKITEYQRPPSPAREHGLALAGQFRALAIADFDHDGHLDIVGGAASPGTVAIWYGNGRGSFSEPVFLPIKGDVRSVAAADVNEDGWTDIVCSVQKEASGIMVWYHQPERRWIRGTGPVEANNYQGIQTADINRDGHVDIIAANATSDSEGGIQIWLGDGKGNWPIESGPTVNGRYMDVMVADFDRDGFLDLAGAGWGTYGGIRIWFGNGTGNWSTSPPLDVGSFNGLTVADINADGNLDILAGTYRSGIRIFLGNGKGDFVKAIAPTTDNSFWKAILADPDKDGQLELIAGSVNSKGITVWKKQWRNIWTPADLENLFLEQPELKHKKIEVWVLAEGLLPSFGDYYDLITADLNHDSYADLCAASFGEGVRLWMGKGGILPESRTVEPSSNLEQTPASKQSVSGNDVFTTIGGYPEYRIGPGDLLEITMWRGSTGAKEEIQVRPDGKISFAFVEDLLVTGLTPTQLDDLLTKDLKAYIREPRIDITVKKYQSKYVTMTGEIYTNVTFRSGPGKYELTGKTTLLEMLSKAGGPTPNSNLRDVKVRRQNGQTFAVDLYKVINYGDISQDIILDDGDLVFIPAITKEANRVYVFGEVEKPGVYTFTGSEMRLFDAISQAGGFTVFGFPKDTRIVRGDISRPELLSADLQRLMEDGDQTQNIYLANGDLVYVPRSFIGDINLFLKKISPIMNLIAIPGRVLRDVEATGDVLRLD